MNLEMSFVCLLEYKFLSKSSKSKLSFKKAEYAVCYVNLSKINNSNKPCYLIKTMLTGYF